MDWLRDFDQLHLIPETEDEWDGNNIHLISHDAERASCYVEGANVANIPEGC